MTVSSSTLVSAALLLLACPALAQRDLTDIPDPDPQKELEQLRVAEGYEINLFASDPDIAKPIQMNWDARGRLWVATSSVYPMLEPGETANDRIVILEDTNGDGHADKTTVFADGLLIPTGVLPSGNGAYVANSTELLFMEDTDGDGRADKTTEVFTGFGTEDTHHILHMLRHGPGGYVYFNQSIYIHSNLETAWGPKRLDAGGIWRFRPATMELDVWVRGFVNPWGHQFDDWGQEFVTDGAFGEGINYVFPGAAFVAAAGAERKLRGLSPGQPKHCGLAILSGRHLPEEARGTFLANDFRGHRVNRFALKDSQSGYVARQMSDLVWTDHVAFRPIDVNTGPDGAIYIADWYNPIIQHGEVDFRDPRRDRTHGRIWRVTAKDRALVPKPQLHEATPEQLATALKSPERWSRDAARQLIAERGEAVMAGAVEALVEQLDPADADRDRHRLEALWATQSLNLIDPVLLARVQASGNPRVRAAAMRVTADWSRSLSSARELLTSGARDPHARVRLEAVNGLRALGDADAVRRALVALDQPLDENLDYALWLTCRELQWAWLPVLAQDPEFLGGVERLVFALNAAGSAESLAPAVALWKKGELSASERAAAAGLIGRFGGPGELDLLARADTLANPETRKAALAALLTAARQRKVAPKDTASITALLADADADDDARATAAELVGLARSEYGPALLAALADDDLAPARVRYSALKGLAADGRPLAALTLASLTEPGRSVVLRARAAAALARIDAQAAAGPAARVLADAASADEASGLTAAFLAVKGGPEHLAAALEGITLPESAATAALQAVSTSPSKAEGLAQALRTSAQLGPLALELSPQDLALMVQQVRDSGDARRGERLYRRENQQCVRCHAIGGAGGVIGPDLTSIGGSAQVDYLIESLLQPNSKIKEGYHTTTVLSSDGTIAAGVLLSRTDEQLVLRDSNGEEIVIPVDDIEQEVISPVSLMPTGLITELRRSEFVDLVAFLSQLGKQGEFHVGPQRLVRSWQVLDVTPAVSGALRAQGVQAPARRPEAFPWRPLTSTVAGALPLGEVPAGDFFAGQRFRLVRFGLHTPEAGPALLLFSSAQGIKMFLDGEPVTVTAETSVELPAGTSAVTLILEQGRFPDEALTVELRDAVGSPARADLPRDF